MVRIKELKGHSSCALHMTTSPAGTLVTSAGDDETIRIWNVFSDEKG
jgi:WD40 repeat protein